MAFYFLISCLFPLLNAFQAYGLPPDLAAAIKPYGASGTGG